MNTDLYCDRCGAAAKSRFVLNTGDLFFCGHHTREYSENLLDSGAVPDLEYGASNTDLATV